MSFPKEKYEKLYSKRDYHILNLYHNGLNTIQIGSILGINDSVVGRVLKRNQIQPKGNSLTLEQRNQIKSLFADGWNTVQIAKQLGISDTTVGRNLKKLGLRARNYTRKFSVEKEKAIVNEYLLGKTCLELGSNYNVDSNTIANIVRRNGGKVRPNGTPPNIKFPNFFETIDSEEKAYFLGLMITDGSIVTSKEGKTSIGLMLKEEDKYIIDKFAQILGFEPSKVKVSNRKEAYLRFHSAKMVEDLAKYGVVPNKTLTTYVPEVRIDLVPHLLRGMFDGDGSIFLYNPKRGTVMLKAAFYGTPIACEQFQNHLIQSISISKTKVYEKVNHSFISISRKQDLLNLFHYFYSNANIYLIRKKTAL